MNPSGSKSSNQRGASRNPSKLPGHLIILISCMLACLPCTWPCCYKLKFLLDFTTCTMDKANEFQDWVQKFELSESPSRRMDLIPPELWAAEQYDDTKTFCQRSDTGSDTSPTNSGGFFVNCTRLCGLRSRGIGKGTIHPTGQDAQLASHWCHPQCSDARPGYRITDPKLGYCLLAKHPLSKPAGWTSGHSWQR